MIKTWNTMVEFGNSPIWIRVQSPRTRNWISITESGGRYLSVQVVMKIHSLGYPDSGSLVLTLSELQELFEASKITDRHPGCTVNSEETDSECPECDAMMASRCI